MFGADPEFLLINDRGEPVSAHKFPGLPPKGKKIMFGTLGAHRDGFGLELNPNPHYCCAVTLKHVAQGLAQLAPRLKDLGLRISCVSSAKIPVDEILKDPDTPKGLLDRGCDPSFNAYTEGPVQAQLVSARRHPYREFAGHLHLTDHGGFKMNVLDRWVFDLVKLWDLYVGLPDAIIFGGEAANRRRLFYGQAGDFRLQDHGGLEYRVPSSDSWGHPAIVALYWQSMRRVWNRVKNSVIKNGGFDIKRYEPQWNEGYEQALRLAINTGKDARSLVRSLPEIYNRKEILELADRRDELRLRDFHWNWLDSPDALGRINGTRHMNIHWPEFAGRPGPESNQLGINWKPASCWHLRGKGLPLMEKIFGQEKAAA